MLPTEGGHVSVDELSGNDHHVWWRVFRRAADARWKEIAGASVIPVLTERVRGTSKSDIFVVGNFGVVAHYNGLGFKVYPELGAALVYMGLDYKDDRMIAIGYSSDRAIVASMWRQGDSTAKPGALSPVRCCKRLAERLHLSFGRSLVNLPMIPF